MSPAAGSARPWVSSWLFACAGLVFAMIVLGGVTRLTESGLSIVQWRPVSGVLPPLDDAAWQAAFAEYQRYPEYQTVNQGMTLAAFKTIFWFEYAHRLLGRLIGAVFLGGLVAFAALRQIDRGLALRLALIFVAGGLQGALGWYMVASGLVERPDVSQYRLAAHLMVAVLIYLLILWTALDVARGGHARGRASPGLGAYLGLALATIASGAFVAGTDAGFAYNTFPRMGERWVPLDLWRLEPWWLNHVENIVMIQFQHRLLALATAAGAVLLWLADRRRHGPILAAAALQAGLGIATLVLVVPIPIAAAHQAGAVLLVTVIAWTLHGAPRHGANP